MNIANEHCHVKVMLRSFYFNGHTYKVLSRHFEVRSTLKKREERKEQVQSGSSVQCYIQQSNSGILNSIRNLENI